MKEAKKGISLRSIEQMSKAFHADRANEVASRAAVSAGVMEAAKDYEALRKLPMNFSIDLKQGKITNQRASGRCWIFAALNIFRYEMIKKFDLDTIELSQNYLFFWDKLEKANYYLESVLATVDEPIEGRLFSFISLFPLGDGGQWDMIVNLVEKYGLVPQEAYPDSENSRASRSMVSCMTTKLHEDAMLLRNAAKEGKKPAELQAMKGKMLEEMYRMLCISLGEPPKTFNLTLRNKKDEVFRETGITPKEFFDKYVGMDLQETISVINGPTADKPFNQMYTVKFLGNMVGGRPATYLNLTMDKIKKAVIRQLKDGHPVWFGSDCGKFSIRKDGVFDRESAGVEKLFNVRFGFTKAEYLDYGDSAMNHAMVILGVNLDADGKPDRWHIENSWGKDAGLDGYFVASDDWFNDFVYQVMLNTKYLDASSRKLLSGPLNELKPWDPFGTLAD